MTDNHSCSALEEPLLTNEGASPLFGTTRTHLPKITQTLKLNYYTIQIFSTPDLCRAILVHDESPGLRRSYLVDVRFEKGFCLKDFNRKSSEWQEGHMHLFFRDKVPSLLYIGNKGLRGGGNMACSHRTGFRCHECGLQPWVCVCGFSCNMHCWNHCWNESHYMPHVCRVCSMKTPMTYANCPRYKKCITCNSTTKCSRCCGCFEKAQEQERLRKEQEERDRKARLKREEEEKERLQRVREQKDEESMKQFREKIMGTLISDLGAPVSDVIKVETKTTTTSINVLHESVQEPIEPTSDNIAEHAETSANNSKKVRGLKYALSASGEIKNADQTPSDDPEVIETLQIQLESILTEMMRNYAKDRTTDNRQMYEIVHIPNITDEIKDAANSTCISLARYISKRNRIDFDSVIDLPVFEWVVTLLCEEIKSSPFSYSSEPYLTRFVDLVGKLKDHENRYDAESLLFEVQDKQMHHRFTLSKVNELLTFSSLDLKKSAKILEHHEPHWESQLQSHWLEKSLTRLFRDSKKSKKRLREISSDILQLELLVMTLDKLFIRVERDADFDKFIKLISYLKNQKVDSVRLNRLLTDAELPVVSQFSLLDHWFRELEDEDLSKHLSHLDPGRAQEIRNHLLQIQFHNWNHVEGLLSGLNEDAQKEEFIASLEWMVTYGADESMCEAAFTEMSKNSYENWERSVHQLLVDRTFASKTSYNVEDFVDEIVRSASGTTFCEKKILLDHYYSILKQYHSFSASVQSVALNNKGDTSEEIMKKIQELSKRKIVKWEESDITLWAKMVLGKNEPRISSPSLAEMIAIVQRGVILKHQMTPRAVQLMSLITLLNPEEGTGRLIQVNTGEGKSLVVAMLAVIHALGGKKVDVVTTSTELSKREVDKQNPFYKLFGLTVAENSDFDKKHSTYTCDIVYGTTGHFIADILRTEFLGEDVRGDRPFHVVIVDEVDSMLYDNRTHVTRLCSGIPMMQHLNLPLSAMWNHLNTINRHFVPGQGKNLFVREPFTIDAKGNFKSRSGKPLERCSVLVEDPVTFFMDEATKHLDRLLRKIDSYSEEGKMLEAYEKIEEDIFSISREISEVNMRLESAILASNDDGVVSKRDERSKLQEEVKKVEEIIKTSNDDSPDSNDSAKYKSLLQKLQEFQARLEKSVDGDLYGKKQKLEEKLKSCRDKLRSSPWNKEYPVLQLPVHLRDFSRNQVKRWSESGLGALCIYKPGYHYVLDKGKIIPIDFDNTGVLERNMVWSNGLNQFLQMKEGLMLQPETVSTNYMSTPGFLKRYGSCLFGLTGTFGNEANHRFFINVYDVDLIVIPPHEKRQILNNSDPRYLCKVFPSIVVNREDEWHTLIVKQTLKTVRQKRAVLIICKYIKWVEDIVATLRKQHPSNKIFSYTGNVAESFEVTRIQEGEILVATNIAGRGTDIVTSEEVENNGGLHVIIAFLPVSYRVYLQNIGRTGRSGNKGSAQLILYDPHSRNISELVRDRDSAEESALKKAEEDTELMLVQDGLFMRYCALQRELIPRLKDARKAQMSAEMEEEWRKRVEFLEKNSDAKYDEHVRKTKERLKRKVENDDSAYDHDDLNQRKKVTAAALKDIDNYDAEPDRKRWKQTRLKRARDQLCLEWTGRVPSDVVACFRHGKPYANEENDSNPYRYNGIYEQKGLAEQWALWYHEKYYELRSGKDLDAAFEQFKEKMTQLALRGELIQNPIYEVERGNYHLQHNDFESAIKAYKTAIDKDPSYSLSGHYNMAIAQLSNVSNAKVNQKEALDHLLQVQKLIDKTYRPELLEIGVLSGEGSTAAGDNMSSEHIRKQTDIVERISEYTEMAINVIRNAMEKDTNPTLLLTRLPLEEMFGDTDTGSYATAIASYRLNGVDCVFTLKEELPSLSFWQIIVVTVVNVAQIAVGVCLMKFTGGKIGLDLVLDGVFDLISTFRSIFNGTFDWTTWATHKATRVTMAVIFAGLNALLSKFDSLEGTITGTMTSLIGDAGYLVTVAAIKNEIKDCVNTLRDNIGAKLVTDNVVTSLESVLKDKLLHELKTNPTCLVGVLLDEKNKNNKYEQIFIETGLAILEDSDGAVMKEIQKIMNKNESRFAKLLPAWMGRRRNEASDNLSTKDLNVDFIACVKLFTAAYKKKIDELKTSIPELSTDTEGESRQHREVSEDFETHNITYPVLFPSPTTDVLDADALGINREVPVGGYSSEQSDKVKDEAVRMKYRPSSVNHIYEKLKTRIVVKLQNKMNSLYAPHTLTDKTLDDYHKVDDDKGNAMAPRELDGSEVQ